MPLREGSTRISRIVIVRVIDSRMDVEEEFKR
jgi:hypothetical protein